jgi:hypothetical protein
MQKRTTQALEQEITRSIQCWNGCCLGNFDSKVVGKLKCMVSSPSIINLLGFFLVNNVLVMNICN